MSIITRTLYSVALTSALLATGATNLNAQHEHGHEQAKHDESSMNKHLASELHKAMARIHTLQDIIHGAHDDKAHRDHGKDAPDQGHAQGDRHSHDGHESHGGNGRSHDWTQGFMAGGNLSELDQGLV